MKRFDLSMRLAIVAFVTVQALRSAPAAELVPFKGRLAGNFTATPIDPTNPLILALQLNATGDATQLGAFIYDFPHRVDRSTIPSTGIGSCTFTAANGDRVFADINGQARPIAPGILYGVEIGVIRGGTGRFLNATGNFTIERVINQLTLSTYGSFTGTISSPGTNTR